MRLGFLVIHMAQDSSGTGGSKTSSIRKHPRGTFWINIENIESTRNYLDSTRLSMHENGAWAGLQAYLEYLKYGFNGYQEARSEMWNADSIDGIVSNK